jgi:TrmH family RNA methyltransferase
VTDPETELSPRNPRVQRLRRLATDRSERRSSGLAIVEGRVLVGEAIGAGLDVVEEFVGPGGEPVGRSAVRLGDEALRRVATTEEPQPNVAIVRIPVPPALSGTARVIVADRISDPGNLGTVVRSAEAAGLDAVVVTPGTTDPWSPKAIRASAGAVFHVPVIESDLLGLRSAGLRLVGTSSHRGEAHVRADLAGPVAVVLGNEAHGLDDSAPVDSWVRIDHRGRSESLNVAMAGTLLAFRMAECSQGRVATPVGNGE